MIQVSNEDFGTLAICAIRYCQGRQTYMPEMVRGIVKVYIKDIEDRDLQVMINDCETQAMFNDYGDEQVDKPGWIEWKEKLLEEKARREGN